MKYRRNKCFESKRKILMKMKIKRMFSGTLKFSFVAWNNVTEINYLLETGPCPVAGTFIFYIPFQLYFFQQIAGTSHQYAPERIKGVPESDPY